MSETETLERPSQAREKRAVDAPLTFRVVREDLLAAIRAVSQVVESRVTIPILANLLVASEDGAIVIRGTDLNMMAEIRLPCEVGAQFATTVDQAGLQSAVETMRPGAVIEAMLADEDRRLVLKHGRAVRNLPTLPPSDFPPMVLDSPDAEFEMEARILRNLLDAAAPAMSTEEAARPYLCGVYLHAPDMDSFRAIGLDGSQMVRASAPQPHGAGGMPGVIVSRKTVGLFRRVLDAHSDSQLRFRVDAKKVEILVGRMRLTSKVVEGTFPPYDRMIPAGNDKILKVHSAELRRCITATAALAESRGKARVIILELGPDECQARAASTAGAVVDPLDGEFPHEAMSIGLNERLAGPLVGVFGEAAQLEVAIDAPNKPVVITSPDKPGITAVLGTIGIAG
jgi:DNA polymerase-3 subunit beta